MAHPHQLIPGLVAVLARRLISHTEYDKQLHILYLANDVLFKALQGRQPPGSAASVDPIASAFLPVLSPMLAAAYQRGGRAEEVSLVCILIRCEWSMCILCIKEQDFKNGSY